MECNRFTDTLPNYYECCSCGSVCDVGSGKIRFAAVVDGITQAGCIINLTISYGCEVVVNNNNSFGRYCIGKFKLCGLYILYGLE